MLVDTRFDGDVLIFPADLRHCRDERWQEEAGALQLVELESATRYAVPFKPDYEIHIERDPERGDVVYRGASRFGSFEERHPANTGAITPWSIRTVAYDRLLDLFAHGAYAIESRLVGRATVDGKEIVHYAIGGEWPRHLWYQDGKMIRFCGEEPFGTYIETILEAYADRERRYARAEPTLRRGLRIGERDDGQKCSRGGCGRRHQRLLRPRAGARRVQGRAGGAPDRQARGALRRDRRRGVRLRCRRPGRRWRACSSEVDDRLGALEVVHYNASYRTRGPLVDLDPAEVQKSLMVSAFGGFLVAQQAVLRMLRQGGGAILFTGASASVKGYAGSASFAMGKFALRGLAQSMARELAPKNIHVAHFVIDGGVRAANRPEPEGRPDSMLDPDAIAQTYMWVLKQPRSAWTWEVELRPWVETF